MSGFSAARGNWLSGIAILVALALVLAAGCMGTTAKVTGSLAPRDVALRPADLPEGYNLSAEGEVSPLDIPPEYRNLGLRDGYMVSFYRANGTDMTGLTQVIARFSPGEKDRVLSSVFRPGIQDPEGLVMNRLPDPGIGERSEAYEVSTPAGSFVRIRFYMITFVKGDFVEILTMTGTATDRRMPEEFAGIAGAKIP